MSLYKTFLEELETVKEADFATREQARDGIITGFKERDESDNEIYDRFYNYAKNDESFISGAKLVNTLINDFGIHPSLGTTKKFFGMPTKDGKVKSFRPARLNIQDGTITIDYYRNNFVPGEGFVYSPYASETMSLNKFIEVTNAEPNERIKASLLKDDPDDDPDYWHINFNKGYDIFLRNAAKWAKDNNKDYELNKYDNKTLKKLYYLVHRKGYTIEQAMNTLKDEDQLNQRKFINKESILDEAKSYTSVEDNPIKVRKVLDILGINNPENGMDFTQFPFKIEFDQTEDPDNNEPTKYYAIAGIPNNINSYNPSEWKFNELYLRNVDPSIEGARAFPMKIVNIRKSINEYLKNNFEDGEFHPDEDWYTAYYILNPRNQPKIYRKPRLKGKVLPAEAILFVLDQIDKNPTKDKAFKYVDSLVDLYKKEPANPLILEALKSYDPKTQMFFKRQASSPSGYVAYYPDRAEMEDGITSMRATHGNRDVYRRVIKGIE